MRGVILYMLIFNLGTGDRKDSYFANIACFCNGLFAHAYKTVFCLVGYSMTNLSTVEVIDEVSMGRMIERLAHDIVEKNKGTDNLCLVGIRTRGVYLAERIARAIERFESVALPQGILDITFYRDDLDIIDQVPEIKGSELPFSVTGKTIVLIDDVLFTGRTVRAAVETVMNHGRPSKIQLLVLVDRGHRELPVSANFVGKNLPTSKLEKVKVYFSEIDGRDGVEIIKINE